MPTNEAPKIYWYKDSKRQKKYYSCIISDETDNAYIISRRTRKLFGCKFKSRKTLYISKTLLDTGSKNPTDNNCYFSSSHKCLVAFHNAYSKILAPAEKK